MMIERKDNKWGRLWIVSSNKGKTMAVFADEFIQHEMKHTGVDAENTIKTLFAVAFRLQNTLDAIDL
jgi:hypothetical protein